MEKEEEQKKQESDALDPGGLRAVDGTDGAWAAPVWRL